jgi:phosphoribosylglycinamide formyltransferase-1
MSLFRVAVLISGAGSTLRNLIQWKDRGELPIAFEFVLSSRPNAAGLGIAREAEITTHVVCKSDFSDPQARADHVFSLCRQHDVQLVVMGGYLEHLLIPEDFRNRVVNIHPALIPAFCGKGFYGRAVHQAALAYGVKVSGCTVHFVDNEYDHGPIIAQKACPVFDIDTAESLQRRVAELECQLYPQVISAIARGQVSVDGRHVTVQGIV